MVEDNVTNQMVASVMLQKLGFEVDLAATGGKALESLEKEPYDAVLMDVQMPDMDGLEATRRIRDPRSRVHAHDVPIIAMTANAMPGDRERCLKAGMNDYVAKPLSQPFLEMILNKYVKDRGSEGPDSAGSPDVVQSASCVEPQPPVFDKADLEARLGGDANLALEPAQVYLEEMPGMIRDLEVCVSAGDCSGIRLQAHSVKGATASLGGAALTAVALAMETAAKAGDLDAVRAALPSLKVQFEALKAALVLEFNLGDGPDTGASEPRAA